MEKLLRLEAALRRGERSRISVQSSKNPGCVPEAFLRRQATEVEAERARLVHEQREVHVRGQVLLADVIEILLGDGVSPVREQGAAAVGGRPQPLRLVPVVDDDEKPTVDRAG